MNLFYREGHLYVWSKSTRIRVPLPCGEEIAEVLSNVREDATRIVYRGDVLLEREADRRWWYHGPETDAVMTSFSLPHSQLNDLARVLNEGEAGAMKLKGMMIDTSLLGTSACLTKCRLTGSLTSRMEDLALHRLVIPVELFADHIPDCLIVVDGYDTDPMVLRANLIADTYNLGNQTVEAPIASCTKWDIIKMRCSTLLVDITPEDMTDDAFYNEIAPHLHPSIQLCTMEVMTYYEEIPEPVDYLKIGEEWLSLSDVPEERMPMIEALDYHPRFRSLVETGHVDMLFVSVHEYTPPEGYTLIQELAKGKVYRRQSRAKAAR